VPSVRPPELLDKLENKDSVSLNCKLWRVVRQGRDPLACSSAGGRWSDGTFDVLYTSKEGDGAVAEMHFHLRRGQPVFPSKIDYRLFEINTETDNILDLSDDADLAETGIDLSQYGKLGYANRAIEYQKCQMVGEAAFFLGFNGIIVPNARWDTDNVVLFCDLVAPDCFDVVDDDGVQIVWTDWNKKNT